MPTSLVAFTLIVALAAGTHSGAQIMLRDDSNKSVRLPGTPRRIVSLAPSITESLFAIGAGSSLVGVTEYCNHPGAAARLPRVGGITSPNLESILALEPDLILMSKEGNREEDYRRLERLGIPVFVTDPRTLEGIFRSLLQLGTLTGHEREARSLVDSLERRVKAVRSLSTGPPIGTLLFVSLQPPIVAGAGTFLHELLQTAGARNLAGNAAGTYPAFSREAVLAADPDAIFVTTDLVLPDTDLSGLFPEWLSLRAVRNRRVYRIDADIVSRPGPRAIDALEQISLLLHTGSR